MDEEVCLIHIFCQYAPMILFSLSCIWSCRLEYQLSTKIVLNNNKFWKHLIFMWTPEDTSLQRLQIWNYLFHRLGSMEQLTDWTDHIFLYDRIHPDSVSLKYNFDNSIMNYFACNFKLSNTVKICVGFIFWACSKSLNRCREGLNKN